MDPPKWWCEAHPDDVMQWEDGRREKGTPASPRYRRDAAEQLAKSRTTTPELLYMLCDSYFHLGKVSDADLTAETIAAYGRNKPAVIKELNELLLRNGQTELAQRLSADRAQK